MKRSRFTDEQIAFALRQAETGLPGQGVPEVGNQRADVNPSPPWPSGDGGAESNFLSVILVSPLTSGKDHAKASGLKPVSFLAGNAFNNIDKCRRIICPVLVVHGTRDRVIPISMGEEIFKSLKTRKKFIRIEDRGHNDLTRGNSSKYWKPILEFISKTNP